MASSSNLKQVLRRINLVVRCFRKAGAGFHRLLYRVSPEWLAKFRYREAYGRWPDVKSPRTFDEKLLWLMLYWQHPLKSRCADKYEVRSYVEESGLGHLLPTLYGVYENADQIDFKALANQFALKCTHGGGGNYNIICRDKRRLNYDDARHKLRRWLKIDISSIGGEIHYAAIKPRIIAEEFLDDGTGDLPSDFKLYCFEGKAHCTMACTERSSGRPSFDFYDRAWKTKLPYSKSGLLGNRSIPKPVAYDEMLAAAETLSRPFPFVRMDFYDIRGRAVIGEMTFTPHGCIDTGYTESAQDELGRLVKLPQPIINSHQLSSRSHLINS